MNSIRLNNLSLKYQRSTPSDCKDKVIIKFEFEAKTQFRLGKENVFYCVKGNFAATFFRQKVEKGGGGYSWS